MQVNTDSTSGRIPICMCTCKVSCPAAKATKLMTVSMVLRPVDSFTSVHPELLLMVGRHTCESCLVAAIAGTAAGTTDRSLASIECTCLTALVAACGHAFAAAAVPHLTESATSSPAPPKNTMAPTVSHRCRDICAWQGMTGRGGRFNSSCAPCCTP